MNNVAVHGIPDDRPLADGDIINIDITVRNMKINSLYAGRLISAPNGFLCF